jgi:hypothetical protein
VTSPKPLTATYHIGNLRYLGTDVPYTAHSPLLTATIRHLIVEGPRMGDTERKSRVKKRVMKRQTQVMHGLQHRYSSVGGELSTNSTFHDTVSSILLQM